MTDTTTTPLPTDPGVSIFGGPLSDWTRTRTESLLDAYYDMTDEQMRDVASYVLADSPRIFLAAVEQAGALE